MKISKAVRLDGDIVQWLVAEADRTGIPYQTLMNAKLREAMNLPDRVRDDPSYLTIGDCGGHKSLKLDH